MKTVWLLTMLAVPAMASPGLKCEKNVPNVFPAMKPERVQMFDYYLMRTETLLREKGENAAISLKEYRKFHSLSHRNYRFGHLFAFEAFSPEKLLAEMKAYGCETLNLEAKSGAISDAVMRIVKSHDSLTWRYLRASASGLDARQLAYAVYTADYLQTVADSHPSLLRRMGDNVAVGMLYAAYWLKDKTRTRPKPSTYNFLK